MKRLALALAASLVIRPQNALAESKSLGELRSPSYYAWHTGLTAGGLIAALATPRLVRANAAGPYWRSFYIDEVVEQNFSAPAAALSDKLLLTTVAIPPLLQLAEGFGTSFGNASLVYAEAHALNLVLTTTTKLTIRRPRPYTRSESPLIIEFSALQGSEAWVSFFSGHSSTAFTAASAGSLLYAMRSNDLMARHTVWGVQFLLAGMTAQLRVRAGRHYRTDIWVGSLVGTSIGVLVPALHRVPLSRVRSTEIVTAGAASVVTMALSEVVDFCGALGTLGLCDFPPDVRLPFGRASATSASWFVLPSVYEGGAGFQVSGSL